MLPDSSPLLYPPPDDDDDDAGCRRRPRPLPRPRNGVGDAGCAAAILIVAGLIIVGIAAVSTCS